MYKKYQRHTRKKNRAQTQAYRIQATTYNSVRYWAIFSLIMIIAIRLCYLQCTKFSVRTYFDNIMLDDTIQHPSRLMYSQYSPLNCILRAKCVRVFFHFYSESCVEKAEKVSSITIFFLLFFVAALSRQRDLNYTESSRREEKNYLSKRKCFLGYLYLFMLKRKEIVMAYVFETRICVTTQNTRTYHDHVVRICKNLFFVFPMDVIRCCVFSSVFFEKHEKTVL